MSHFNNLPHHFDVEFSLLVSSLLSHMVIDSVEEWVTVRLIVIILDF